MKTDLDRLMEARDMQAFVVVGDELYSAARDYLSNGARLSGGLTLKKRGAPAVLIVSPMEIEEARASGLEVWTWQELGWHELLAEAAGERDAATARLWERALRRLAVPPGRVGIYGNATANTLLALKEDLANLEDYQFVGERGLTLLAEAMLTRDAEELTRIRRVAADTDDTLEAVWNFIAGHHEEQGLVVDSAGAPLTIGMVRRFVRHALLERDLEDTGLIFAQGRDAGFPHSRGQDDMPLRCGQAIVFDLFPREFGGGYHHDVTRTWCIGTAPAELRALHDTVMQAFGLARERYTAPGQAARELQEAVLDFFESAGHPTLRSQPDANEGYTHSLGHGLGLEIHERPALSHLGDDRLQIGNVFCIEPGLYYPERGYGLRIEDTFTIDGNGALVPLTGFHKQLTLPLHG